MNSLGEFRRITQDMPDDTYLIIMNTQDGDTHAIDDVSVNRNANVAYIETSV
jgi:hypothetical protein